MGIGDTVSDEGGRPLGSVRGFDGDGSFVTTERGVESLSVEHERAGPAFGEAEPVWRCSACGDMGDFEAIPDICANCGAPKESLSYWTED